MVNFIITTFVFMYKLWHLFPLQGFVRYVFCYYSSSLTCLHPNRFTTFSAFNKLLGILKVKLMVRVFRRYYMLINSAEERPSILWFFTFFY